MALSYGLSLNVFLVSSVQLQCLLANLIVSVERLEQYMHIPSEAPEIIESIRPPQDWPSVGKVEIYNLQVNILTKKKKTVLSTQKHQNYTDIYA